MPDAFNNGRKRQDTKPYAPGSGDRTPHELASDRGVLGIWLYAKTPITEPYPQRG